MIMSGSERCSTPFDIRDLKRSGSLGASHTRLHARKIMDLRKSGTSRPDFKAL